MSNGLNQLTERIKELEKENASLRLQNIEITQAKELYLKIFEDFPALIWRARLDKLCDYFNKTWLDFTGRTMEQEFGNGWTEGVHPDDFDSCLQTYVTAFDKRESFLMEYRMKNKFGEYRWIRDFGRPFYDLDNSFLGYIGSCYDITEIKQANSQLQKLNADKDLLMAIFAHDLRSPFSSILGFLELLSENIRTNDIDKTENQILIVKSVAQNTYNLLEDLIKWTGAASGKLPFNPQKISFTAICANILETVNPIASSKNITINCFEEGEITLFADEDMLKTVLRNLISNAIKYSNPEGKINIYAKQIQDNSLITVSDNGIGMNSAYLGKLFDASSIHSTNGTANEKGTGFGLILCKEFVEKHGGKIWAKSDLGKGSEFKISIPLLNANR